MTVDILTLLAVLAGFAIIIAGTILAWRQTIQWQHVVIFSLGGVLAGRLLTQSRVLTSSALATSKRNSALGHP